MKISQQTLSILKNYNGLNQHFRANPGSTIRTISAAVIASADIEEEFPIEFAVENLSKFLGVVSLFEDPEYEFYENYVRISEGKNYVRYVYDEPTLLDLPPPASVKIKMPEVQIEFSLSEKDFTTIGRAINSLASPELCIVGEDSTVYLRATEVKNPTVSNFSMAVGVTEDTFNTTFNAANFRFLNRDYLVSLAINKIVRFQAPDVTYWIAASKE